MFSRSWILRDKRVGKTYKMWACYATKTTYLTLLYNHMAFSISEHNFRIITDAIHFQTQ